MNIIRRFQTRKSTFRTERRLSEIQYPVYTVVGILNVMVQRDEMNRGTSMVDLIVTQRSRAEFPPCGSIRLRYPLLCMFFGGLATYRY